ncbi:MAG: 5-formaminoimidazole-4-carboxamide-1-(beta)-D-ribofuranosyl 5'-monophosphate synthetase [Candidatus Altiarchaeales archaeon WOR_SM1_79]|nr:MAG: 5-formaminoimidazole-4-carboxamide-1-(beta)-D-ribofuranosyl 5'-monophosphate synthetase [Candidatus Altiarchaeales archaeon WOR_SM1_79]
MVAQKGVLSRLESYDRENLCIATLCSHTSLQIFNGAKREGFKTLGISVGPPLKFYDAFPAGKPDEFFIVDRHEDILAKADELCEKNVILIPHGSFVEYLGPENFEKLQVPTFGNRKVLMWESSRIMERKWLENAGVKMPRLFNRPEDIDRPVVVKFDGAKGGKGFFIVKNYDEFKKVNPAQKYTIQEYVLGTRYYLHYFYSPIKEDGYRLSKGSLELLSIDRRDETNIDEMYKLGSQEELKKLNIYPSFVVTGNVPLTIRESLLSEVFDMGEKVVEKSFDLFDGIIGPFCLETIVNDKLEFTVFEVSARIVAGTNPFISGSPYSDLISPNVSTGRRIAQEILMANEMDRLDEVLS